MASGFSNCVCVCVCTRLCVYVKMFMYVYVYVCLHACNTKYKKQFTFICVVNRAICVIIKSIVFACQILLELNKIFMNHSCISLVLINFSSAPLLSNFLPFCLSFPFSSFLFLFFPLSFYLSIFSFSFSFSLPLHPLCLYIPVSLS